MVIPMTDKPANQTINRLLEELKNHLPPSEHHLLIKLRDEITTALSSRPDIRLNEQATAKLEFDLSTGCYKQNNDTSRYCPACYESHSELIATQRLSKKLRVCPHCRKSIRPSSK